MRLVGYGLAFLFGVAIASAYAGGRWRSFWTAVLVLAGACYFMFLKGRSRAVRGARSADEWDHEWRARH